MNNTPETDEVLKEVNQYKLPFYTQHVHLAESNVTFENPIVSLCRKLERERNEARLRIKHLQEDINDMLYNIDCDTSTKPLP